MDKKIQLQPKEEFELMKICLDWVCNSKCASPPPHFIKLAVLLRYSLKDCIWVETGTFLGETAMFLAKFSAHVHTIEPSDECFEIARKKLSNINNVTMHPGTSESCLERVISLAGDTVCFWLDGHYSSGITYKGMNETPIKYELSTISKYINNINQITVLIDDVRMCYEDKINYPAIDYYVEWARNNNLDWTIEHDIFIAKSKGIK